MPPTGDRSGWSGWPAGTGTAAAPGAFPPGWYLDPAGAPRWWSGDAWGPYAPAPMAPARSNTAAIIAHVGGITGGFVVPLVVYLVTDKADRFTRHHAATALNWQLTYLIAFFGGFAVAFIGMISTIPTTSTKSGAAMPAGFGIFMVVWLVLMLISVANLVLSIIGIVKASKGEWWHYPVRIRFLKEDPPR